MGEEMTRIEMIRATKAMQTQMLVQRAALGACVVDERNVVGFPEHLDHTRVTAQNHIDALQHVIDELQKKPSPDGP